MIRCIVTNIKELNQVCEPIKTDEDISVLLQDLRDTLATQKGYGLAANQIGVQKCVALYIYNGKEVILINPKITEKWNKVVFSEGCLSIPGIRIITDRYNDITFENKGNTYSAVGLEAIIIQHEIDHLNGLTILNRKHKAR